MQNKSLDQKEVSNNLMMHAAHWKDKYRDSLADLINPDNKLVINENINEAVVFIKNARKKVHEIEHKGGELTQGIWSIYQELDRIAERLLQIQKEVNKEGTRINLNDYPINAVSQ